VRLAGHTYAYRELGLPAALDEIQGLGLELAEVWIGHAPDGPAQAARELDGRGLRVPSISAGGFYRSGTDRPRRAFELAVELGAPVVVACLDPALVAEVEPLVPAGVVLCIENHWDQRLARPEELDAVLAEHSRLASCLDTGHSILAGVAPDRFATALGGRVRHVHLKDARARTPVEVVLGRRLRRRLLDKPAPVFPGRGRLRIDRLRRALEAGGYDGVVTVEHEGPEATAALAELIATWRRAGETS
jgi:sugar phosphate isomerase/epimerase